MTAALSMAPERRTPPSARLPRTATREEILEAIAFHGYAIVERLAPALTARAGEELGPDLEASPKGTGDFMGFSTQRISRLIARSEACRALSTHPLVLSVVEGAFKGRCYHPQLSLTMAVRIGEGETAQSLHRDDNVYPLSHPRPPVVLNTMWAVSDFTDANGATRLVPGSHGWDDARTPTDDESIAAEMPAGSVLFFEGGLYHGGGANQTPDSRFGIVLGYNVAWLRQYENMYLSVPPEIARTLSPQLQTLLGYANHGFLGTIDNDDPRRWLAGESDGTPRDLFRPEDEAKRDGRV